MEGPNFACHLQIMWRRRQDLPFWRTTTEAIDPQAYCLSGSDNDDDDDDTVAASVNSQLYRSDAYIFKPLWHLLLLFCRLVMADPVSSISPHSLAWPDLAPFS